MGMFDYVRSEIVLPDGFEGELQTKDFDCNLCRIEIRADGTLWIERFDQESVPKDERPYPHAEPGTIQAIIGCRRSINIRWEALDFHGMINFYGGRGDEWHEYDAKFTDGKLMTIRARHAQEQRGEGNGTS